MCYSYFNCKTKQLMQQVTLSFSPKYKALQEKRKTRFPLDVYTGESVLAKRVWPAVL